MKTIWKFPLGDGESQRIEMTKGAEILTAQIQGLHVCLWAIVDTEETETEMRMFHVYGTGHPMADTARKYIGTIQQSSFVWHVFEIL